MNIVFIGSGNLATHLAVELKKQQYNIVEVYSRTIEFATILASLVDATPHNNIKKITTEADLYIFSVKDSVLSKLIEEMPSNKGIWLHTAGSISIDIFKDRNNNYGVIYPLQTFSKKRSVDFNTIPFFIEGNNIETEDKIYNLAKTLSNKIHRLSSEKRKYIHVAAVFACNFTNHMYSIADDILIQENIPFDVLLPLIEETAAKVRSIKSHKAQTGPAIRYDENVINKHLDLLKDSDTQEIYKIISKNIYKASSKT